MVSLQVNDKVIMISCQATSSNSMITAPRQKKTPLNSQNPSFRDLCTYLGPHVLKNRNRGPKLDTLITQLDTDVAMKHWSAYGSSVKRVNRSKPKEKAVNVWHWWGNLTKCFLFLKGTSACLIDSCILKLRKMLHTFGIAIRVNKPIKKTFPTYIQVSLVK